MTRPIRVGHIDLSFHDAAAREVERILIARGHRIERSAAPHEEMFRRMGDGEVDVLVSAWLPASHGAYLAPFVDEVRKVTVLYEPYCIWGVPDYVPEASVAEVADLLREPAAGTDGAADSGNQSGRGYQSLLRRHGGPIRARSQPDTNSGPARSAVFRPFRRRRRRPAMGGDPAVAAAMAAPSLPDPRASGTEGPARRQGSGDADRPQGRRRAHRRFGAGRSGCAVPRQRPRQRTR